MTRLIPNSRSERFVACVLAVGALDLGLEQFMIIPILPAVQQTYGASLTATTWLLTGFLLAAVTAAPIAGRLGDVYGKRRFLLLSVGAFAIGTRVCALAGSLTALIAGRVLQGAGAGLAPLAVGLARDLAPGSRARLDRTARGRGRERRRRRPAAWRRARRERLGGRGVLVHVRGRGRAAPGRGGVRTGVAAARFAPTRLGRCRAADDCTPSPSARDLPGQHVGLGLCTGRDPHRSLGALFAGFVVVERAASAPLVDMQLLARRPAWSANLVSFAMGFALFISGVVVPQIARLPPASGYGLGLTFAETGLVLLPGALAIVVGGWASGALVPATGARILVSAGAAAAAVAYAWLALDHGSVGSVVAANVPLGFGIGLAFAALTNLVVRAVSEQRTAVFAATTAVSRATGAALGTQVAAAVIIGAGVVAPGFPAERGFTGAFVLGLIAALVALAATVAIPHRRRDPLRQDAQSERTVAAS